MERDQLGGRVKKGEIVSRKCQSENPVQSKTKLIRLQGELKESKAKLQDATNQIRLLEKSAEKLSHALAQSDSSMARHTRKTI